MRVAVCPGSFDPITHGHLDIIKRSHKLFDHVVVLIVTNPDKRPVFSPEERLAMTKKSVSHIENVTVEVFEGLLVDYVKKNDITAVVRGLRAVSDFEYEFQMALVNKRLYDGIETIYLNAAVENMYLSSSVVRDVARFGGDISQFVPEVVCADVLKKLGGFKK